MKLTKGEIAYAIFIIALIVSLMLFLPLIPGFLDEPTEDKLLGWQWNYIFAFILFNVIYIGIPFLIHRVFVKDYTKMKNIIFFMLFGTILAVLFGEGGNPVMLIPYGFFMAMYAYLYNKFTWWKVAITTYIAGIVAENIMNRSPIQIPTLMWIGLFTMPYFLTKIFENRRSISPVKIFWNLKWTFLASIILGMAAWFVSQNNVSPPLIILGAALPFFIYGIIGFIKWIIRLAKGELTQGKEIRKNVEPDNPKDLIPIFIVLALFAAFLIGVTWMVERGR